MAKRTDTNQTAIAQLLRAAGCVVADTHMVADGYPDLTIGYQGKIALVEVKNGPRGRLTPAEVAFHAEWAGLPVYIIANDDDALQMLDELREDSWT